MDTDLDYFEFFLVCFLKCFVIGICMIIKLSSYVSVCFLNQGTVPAR